MDFNERDDDDLTDDDEVTSQRARARAELDQIARRVRQALDEQGIGIDIPVFFLLPNPGNAVVLFGTVTDPPDDQWEQVSQTVSTVVRQVVGLDAVRCREVACASTDEAQQNALA